MLKRQTLACNTAAIDTGCSDTRQNMAVFGIYFVIVKDKHLESGMSLYSLSNMVSVIQKRNRQLQVIKCFYTHMLVWFNIITAYRGS